jgi:hypothetical protein
MKTTMKTAILLLLMSFPLVMMGQASANSNIYATITAVNNIESIPDSTGLHFRVQSEWNFLMDLTVSNIYGTSSTEILTSPSTDLFLPGGRRTPGMEVVFNYN